MTREEKLKMTDREKVLYCIENDVDVSCGKDICRFPEQEGNTGDCCRVCAEQLLKRVEDVAYNKAIDDFFEMLVDYDNQGTWLEIEWYRVEEFAEKLKGE